MNIVTKSSLVNIDFDLPHDWHIVLDVNNTEGKINVFDGVLVVLLVSTVPPRFDSETNTIYINRGAVHVTFREVSASIAKMIKNAMKVFIIRYKQVKSQLTTANNNGSELLVKKSSIGGKYSIHQVGDDGGAIGLVLIVNENDLKTCKIISGVSLLDCGDQFPRMVFSVETAKYTMKFSRIMGEYCIGTLNCLNNYAGTTIKQKIIAYFGLS